jgi:putative ABC transport system permease protein
MQNLLRDLRYGARALLNSPGGSALAVLTLALGIGVNAAMFSMANRFLWRGPAVREPERLAILFAKNRADGSHSDYSHADLRDFREGTGAVFQGLAGYYPLPLSLSLGTANERVWGEVVSGNYFDVLGVPAAAGRTLRADEDRAPGAAPVVVISHRLWRTRFASRPDAVGRTVKVNGRPFTVVGVAPEGFDGIYFYGFRPDLWAPAMMLETLIPGTGSHPFERGQSSLRLAGRLRPGVSVAQAQAVVGAIGARLEKEFPQTNRGYDAVLVPEPEARPEPDGHRDAALSAALFLAGVGLVLLIACANVAHLMLVRATARQPEMAVRLALGAQRRDLLRQLLAESLLLSLAGGLLGVAFAYAGTEAMARAFTLPTDIPFRFDFGLDGRALLYTLGASLAAALVSGLTPAWQSMRTDVVGTLKKEGPGTRGSGRSRLRQALVVSQVAVSCLLLTTAGLALRTLRATLRVDPGFQARGALLVSVAPGLQGYAPERGRAFYAELLQRARALPGVSAAALARHPPLDFSSNGGTVVVDGQAPRPDAAAESVGWSRVSPGYFEAMGTALVAGRGFTEQDREGAHGVVVVNETLAQRYWPGRSALGQSLRLNGPEGPALEVVGVARNGKYRGLTEPPQPYLYLPLAQDYRPDATLVLRSGTDPRALLPAVREAVRALDPDMPVYDVKTLEQLVAGRALVAPTMAAGLAGVFAALALLLAAVGLYGVMSYTVARRVREIGIRMALGAPARSVRRLVVGEGARLCAIGAVLGLLGALGLTRLSSSLLFGVRAIDPLTFAAVPVVLLLVAMLAAYLPSRRATAVDPILALRSE